MPSKKHSLIKVSLWVAAIAIVFVVYCYGLSANPPGFYLDESAPAYNAYLMAHTGVSEFGQRFPLYFQNYTDGFTQYADPVQIYLLAVVFKIFPASILVARVFSACGVFTACLLLGVLAARTSRNFVIGVIVAATALLTPWFFEARGLLLEPQFVPLALVPFLLSVHYAHSNRWNLVSSGLIALTLGLLTYSYTSGRLLSALLAFGLLSFATCTKRLRQIFATWCFYALSLIPILVFNFRHPGLLTKRLYEISYIRPGVPLSNIASEFARRYLEDQSLSALLLNGDYHPRHHVQGSGGAIFFATFILAVLGLLIVIGRRWRNPWWRFVVYGLFVAIVPGAISTEPFHQMRLMAYPVFLLLLTVPALEFLFSKEPNQLSRDREVFSLPNLSRATGLVVLASLLVLTLAQAIYFQSIFRRDGPKRQFDFDVPYKAAYDAAVAQPNRPIYLEDGKWGPAYIHALWYATLERRPTSEFVHLAPGAKPPTGGLVISTEENCHNCEILERSGVYMLYKSK